MAHCSETDLKRVFVEMAAIVFLAIFLGLTWNHRLLLDAWTGNAPGSPVENSAALKERLPLPLGLSQVKELYDRKEVLLVDARDEAAFAAGHIRGAVSLPLGRADTALSQFKQRVSSDHPLAVYCNGYDCRDSFDLGVRLLQEGYRTVYVYGGGFPEWHDAGYPTREGNQ